MSRLTHKGKVLLMNGSVLTFPPPPPPVIDTSFQFEMTNVLNTDTIVLPTREMNDDSVPYVYDYVVDWGDGTILPVTSWDDSNASHQYVDSGTYTIKISGICESFSPQSGSYGQNIIQYLSKIVQWGNVGFKYINFTDCYNLTDIVSDTIGSMSSLTSLYSCFSNCTSLISISNDIFDYCTNVTDFTYCFSNCTSLTTIPSGLFKNCNNANQFAYTFSNCTSLITIPSGLFNNIDILPNFTYCFYNCSSLQTIPLRLFDNCNAPSFWYTFYQCPLNCEAPELWIKFPAESTYCFASCTLLTNYYYIPSGWGGPADNPDYRFKMFITTTSPNQSITLPHLELDGDETPYTYDYEVDYGDGTILSVTSFDDINCTHIYTTEGEYYLKIDGTCETLYVNNIGDIRTTITEITSWGSTTFKQINFYGCTNLRTIPTDISSLSMVTDFINSFRDCTSMIGEVPEFWETYSSLTGTDCFSGDTQLSNYPWIPIPWGGLGEPNPYITITKPDYGDPMTYVDRITDTCWITRSDNYPIYNTIYDINPPNNYLYTSPANTEWNMDGWSDLSNITGRTYNNLYNTLYQSIGTNIVGKEFIMHIITDDLYYRVKFTQWTSSGGGGFSYKRTTDPISTGVQPEPMVGFTYFMKEGYADWTLPINRYELTSLVWLTRADTMGLFNIYSESSFDNDDYTSPADTEWNTSDKWNDLDNVSARTYDTWTNAFGGQGNLGFYIGQNKSVVHTITEDRYFQVIFFTWSQSNGGGFSLLAKEIITNPLLRLEITTTNTNEEITIPMLSGYSYNYIVDYGDGTVLPITSWDDSNRVHEYEDAGVYELTISGLCESFYVDNGDIKTYITDILHWGNVGLKKISFYGCNNLVSIANDTVSLSMIIDWNNTFRDCTSLTTIPTSLFSGSSGVTDFSYVFANCSNLESIPLTLFNNCTGATNFTSAFQDCVSLMGNVPELWVTYSGLTGTDCFSGDTLVTDWNYIPLEWGGGGYSNPWMTFTKTDYGTEVDQITDTCWITRGDNSLIYNPVYEVYNQYNYSSPANTEWNADGWTDLSDVTGRTYQSFYNTFGGSVGDNIVDTELILHIISDDLYYRVKFTQWTDSDSGGGFSYDRTINPLPITPEPLTTFTLFQKTNYGSEVDELTPIVWITRGDDQGIFNSYSESSYVQHTSPADTEWNADGWSDLSDVSGRTYDTLYNVVSSNLGYNLVTKRLVMHAITDDKYYQVVFIQWTVNNNGGGFVYLEKEIVGDISFTLEITTTISDYELSIPCLELDDESNPYVYDYMIDYGDGTIEHITSYIGATHTYLTPNVYTLKIDGTCETFDTNGFPGSSMNGVLTQVLKWGDIKLKKLGFSGCDILTSLGTSNTNGLSLITDFSYSFSYCASLTTIPSNLFEYATGSTNFSLTFEECTSLISIPSTLFNNCLSVTDFSYTFLNCSSLTGNAPALWLRMPEPTGTDCFSGCTSLTNYPYIPISWGGLGQIDTKFKLEMTTTTSNYEVSLPLTYSAMTATFDFIVDWGDGSSTSHIVSSTDPNRVHYYVNPGTYTMSISGICEIFAVFDGDTFNAIGQVITKVLSWGNIGIRIFNFTACAQLNEIPSDTYSGLTLLESLSVSFAFCTSLTTIPSGLFDNCTGVTSCEGLFIQSSITSIPSGLFDNCTNVTTFESAFDSCTSLTGNAPELWLRIPEPIGTNCFLNDTGLDNYVIIPIEWGGLGYNEPLEIEIETSGATLIKLPHLDGYNYNYFVDFGDGSPISHITGYTDDACTHTYATADTFVISITGLCETFYISDSGNTLLTIIKRILSWGRVGLKKFGVSGSLLLTDIPTDTYSGLTLMEDFYLSFASCRNLTIIPEGIFDYCTDVTSFQGIFSNCTGITSLPNGLFDNCLNVTDFSYALYNIGSGMTGTAPELWLRSPEPTGTGCFTNDSSLINYPYIPIEWGGLGQTTPEFILEITTSGREITMPHESGYTYDYVVDYGDGTINHITSYNDTGATHTYESGTYTMKISGICETFFINSGYFMGIRPLITKVIQWGDVGLKLVNFYGCSNLTQVPDDSLSGLTQVTNFNRVFAGTKLTTVPSNLFRYATNATDFGGAFESCYSLSSIPSGLFDYCPNVTNVKNIFYFCTGLTSIPNFLFEYNTGITDASYAFYNCQTLPSVTNIFRKCNKITTFESTFRNCFALTSIPNSFFSGKTLATNFSYTFSSCNSLSTTLLSTFFVGCGNVTTFSYTFSSCYALPSIPSGLFNSCTGVTDFSFTFSSTNITSIPTGLFDNCTKVTNFGSTFSSTDITTIPTGLFDNCTGVTSFYQTFMQCPITSIPTGLFDNCTKVTIFQNTFNGCYQLTSIPTGLFDNCTGVTSFQGTFQTCNKLTSIPSGLFNNCPNVATFYGTFQTCTSLTSIPSTLFNNCTGVTTFGYTFYQCLSLTGVAPSLWTRIPEPNGTQCFNSVTGLTNYPYIPITWGGLGQEELPLELEIATTNINQIVTLPHVSGYAHNYSVDWGDGSAVSVVTSYNDTDRIHTYSVASGYTIRILGICGSIVVDSGNTLTTLLKRIKSWGRVGLSRISFTYCSNLISVVGDIYSGLTSVTDISNLFASCTKLESIPTDLFNYCTGVTNANGTFSSCRLITSIPIDLFKYNIQITSFQSTFYGCNSLTGITSGIFTYNTKVTDFSSVFAGCTGLTTISSNLFDTNTGVTNFSGAFQSCSRLANIPTDLFRYNINVTNISSLFNGCYMTGITSGLFDYNTKITSFYRVFDGCSQLVTIPVDLFRYNTGVTSFQQTFSFCSQLVTIPTDLFRYNTLVTSFNGLFVGCYKLETIPTDIFRYNINVTDFGGTFASCHSITGLTSDLFMYNTNVTNFAQTFSAATGLTSVPSGLFNYATGNTSFYATFYQCYKLASIPEGVFSSCPTSLQNVSDTFNQCQSLTTIPSGLFSGCTNISSFANTFSSCTGLTTLMSNIFSGCTNVTSFYRTFYSCTKLQNIPSGLFDTNINVTSFLETFNYCSTLTGITSDIFNYNTKVTTFQNTFSNCTSLVSGTTSLFDNNTGVTSFQQTFYQCTSLRQIPDYFFRYNTSVTNFSSTFERCYYLQINPWTFYASGEESTRFLNKSVYFSSCFNRTTFLGTQGTAPALWDCNFGTGTPNKIGCYGGAGNSTTSLTNYTTAQSNGWV